MRLSPSRSLRISRTYVDDIIFTSSVSADASWYMIRPERVTSPPSDIVIRARRVAAYAKSADKHPCTIVQPEPAPKHIHTADFPAHHRIIGFAIGFGVPSISDPGINW